LPRRTLQQALAENRSTKTAARVSARRAAALAPKPSKTAITAYTNVMAAYAARVERAVERHVIAVLPEAGLPGPMLLETALANLAAELDGFAESYRRNAFAAGRRASQHARRQVSKLLDVQLPDGTDTFSVRAFAEQNVALIKKASADQVAAVRKALEGEGARQAAVRRSLWVARTRGALIATDQVHKLHYDVVRDWSVAAGVPEYVYVTRRDERVRQSHRPHDGLTFSWASPPNTGHPGWGPGCRCLALPLRSGSDPR
jgi:SPP1 gp7 family putative phage head morphogenesis protein